MTDRNSEGGGRKTTEIGQWKGYKNIDTSILEKGYNTELNKEAL